ncbi:predicted protein [Histoplasma capsulatum var. duboisii H88]|uniref:Predicted protein n=1 Tax=Ajellomyces capsulatus (strain H88) TaxID=544711 RepID=F0U9A1_AJEC8|nr:predicted protein [Histoplasma capsulatum var. duboisii H88]
MPWGTSLKPTIASSKAGCLCFLFRVDPFLGDKPTTEKEKRRRGKRVYDIWRLATGIADDELDPTLPVARTHPAFGGAKKRRSQRLAGPRIALDNELSLSWLCRHADMYPLPAQDRDTRYLVGFNVS